MSPTQERPGGAGGTGPQGRGARMASRSLDNDMPADKLNHFIRSVAYGDEVQLFPVHKALRHHGAFHPVKQTRPEVAAIQHQGERLDAFGLNEHKSLEQFVHGAHAARHDHIGHGIFDKHELAHEEITKIAAGCRIAVGGLLQGQMDVQAHGRPAGLGRSLVAGLHEAGTAAGNDAVAGLHQFAGDTFGLAVNGIIRPGARRTKDRDAMRQFAQGFNAVHDFRHDAEQTPRLLR